LRDGASSISQYQSASLLVRPRISRL